jgi:hypothetical protein
MNAKSAQDLTPIEVTELMLTARNAWDRARPRARKVRFTWRRRPYVSTLTALRMLVDTPDGEPVACRYHD